MCKIRLILRSNDSEWLDISLLPTGKSKHYVIIKGIFLEAKKSCVHQTSKYDLRKRTASPVENQAYIFHTSLLT